MELKTILLFILVFGLVFSISNVFAYEEYIVSDEEFIIGYTKDLSPGDKLIVTIDGEEYYVQVTSIFIDSIKISVSENELQSFGIDHEFHPEEMEFEVTYDNYYDIHVKLNNINWISPREKTASITIKKIHKEIPEGIEPPYYCYKLYTCPDGTQVKECEISGTACLCKNPEELCESSTPSGGEESGGEPIETPSTGSEGSGSANNETSAETIVPCNGCLLEDECVPVGYRTENKYCNVENEFIDQKKAGISCNNNFECSTNLCIDTECVSSGLWQKILRFFKRLFSFDN